MNIEIFSIYQILKGDLIRFVPVKACFPVRQGVISEPL